MDTITFIGVFKWLMDPFPLSFLKPPPTPYTTFTPYTLYRGRWGRLSTRQRYEQYQRYWLDHRKWRKLCQGGLLAELSLGVISLSIVVLLSLVTPLRDLAALEVCFTFTRKPAAHRLAPVRPLAARVLSTERAAWQFFSRTQGGRWIDGWTLHGGGGGLKCFFLDICLQVGGL